VFDSGEPRIAGRDAQGGRGQTEGGVVRERLNPTSQHAANPPSRDGPHVERHPPKERSGRKPGGQPGHPVQRRAVVARAGVDEVVPCQPPPCRRCGRRLTGERDEPVRHQVVGVPLLTPHVTEYQ
jgi:transposase